MPTSYSQRTKASLGGVPVCGLGCHMQSPRISHSQLLDRTEMKSDGDATIFSGVFVDACFHSVCKRVDGGEGSTAPPGTHHARGSEPSRQGLCEPATPFPRE